MTDDTPGDFSKNTGNNPGVAVTSQNYEALGHMRISPQEAIRLFCIQCSGNSYRQVQRRPVTHCRL